MAQTATERYVELEAEVSKKVYALQTLLFSHMKRQRQDPKNWGLVGDLEKINNDLKEMMEGFVQ